ncbi:sulfite exporter TauE/SafE family protein [Crenalkalicoccus roseus]|uniref:sulfite exporter TauE/SafE family protein n=1 Tax=Crenalkalicoccus roseus TaxID=1485588 RepID=UPI0010807D91|nr:sulfite exporter TauE/SafE family protein [Crenalkalicoccus roseus]
MVEDVIVFAAVGFAAQMIDGAIGMAYGLSAASVLLTLGVAPAAASASIHAAEVFTTGASGLAHWCVGNVRRDLVLRLALPGMLGGVLGAFLLVGAPIGPVRVFVSLYLLVLGGVILAKALRPRAPAVPRPWRVALLGFCGGALDAAGGGGWGAIVTSTLIGQGSVPREAIGSANLAEFFVTVAISAAFVATIGLSLWPIIAGLVLGGVLAAPFAALVAKRVPDRPLMVIVAVVVSLLALRNLLLALRALAGGG